MPPEPPKPRPRLSVTEVNATSRAPHTPIPPAEQRATTRPVADPRPPPRELARPRATLPHVVAPPLKAPHVPNFAERDPEPTMAGIGPQSERKPPLSNAPPAERGRIHEPDDIRDSREISSEALLLELAHKADENADLRRQLAAVQPKVEAAPTPAPTVAAITRAAWHSALFKLLVGLSGLIGIVTAYLAARTPAIESKADRTEVRQGTQKTQLDQLAERVAATETYQRTKADWDRCRRAQLDSAIQRGTGHRTADGITDSVQWAEQNKPPTRPPAIWDHVTWTLVKDQGCGGEPKAP